LIQKPGAVRSILIGAVVCLLAAPRSFISAAVYRGIGL